MGEGAVDRIELIVREAFELALVEVALAMRHVAFRGWSYQPCR